jgi:hypothetical protein
MNTEKAAVKQYRKRPVVVEAMQFIGKGVWPIIDWMEASDPPGKAYYDYDTKEFVIETMEGEMKAPPGWWIIRGVAGEFYPCAPDIFAQTYEEADA